MADYLLSWRKRTASSAAKAVNFCLQQDQPRYGAYADYAKRPGGYIRFLERGMGNNKLLCFPLLLLSDVPCAVTRTRRSILLICTSA
jgi:hypothetical protein